MISQFLIITCINLSNSQKKTFLQGKTNAIIPWKWKTINSRDFKDLTEEKLEPDFIEFKVDI